MSERQQLINKYIYDIKPGISAKYQLHFLLDEQDQSAMLMLQSALSQIASETNQKEIEKVMENIKKGTSRSIVFGHKVKEEKLEKEATSVYNVTEHNYSSAANSDMQALRYENALKKYLLAKHAKNATDKYYVERAECQFMLENYDEAYSLAVKSKEPLWMFLTSLVTGRFNEAASYEPFISQHIIQRSENIQARSKIVNSFDLFQLLMFSLFASKPLTEVNEIYKNIISLSINYKFDVIESIMKKFENHQYAEAVQDIDLLKYTIDQSIYSAPVSAKLCKAITENFIINFVRPFGTFRISDIEAATKCNRENICQIIVGAIRSGELVGRIDTTNDLFTRSDSRIAQVRKTYDKLLIIRKRVQLAQWNAAIKESHKFN